MCFIGPNTIFAVYSYDEGPRKTIGTGYGMEKSVRNPGLGICADCVRGEYLCIMHMYNT